MEREGQRKKEKTEENVIPEGFENNLLSFEKVFKCQGIKTNYFKEFIIIFLILSPLSFL